MSGGAKGTRYYLFAATGSVTLLAIAAFTIVSLIALRQTSYRQTIENLEKFTGAVIHYFDSLAERPDNEALDRFCRDFGADPEFRITIVRADGLVIAESNAELEGLENHAERPEIVDSRKDGEGSAVRYSSTINKQMVYYAREWNDLTVRLSLPVDYVDTASRHTAAILVAAALLILLAALGSSSLVSRSIIKPLQALGLSARSHAGGRGFISPDMQGAPRELLDLARTLEMMAQSIKEQMAVIDERNRELEAILTGMNDALIAIDRRQYITRANRAAAELFLFDGQGATGRQLIEVVRNTAIVDFAMYPKPEETETTVEIHTPSPAGNRSLLVKRSPQGTGDGIVLVFSDITRLKKLERIRRDFVANVSHELKTPVTSIQGFIETLQDGAIEDASTARHFLSIMEQQSARLAAIINDLLAISRLEQDEGAHINREKTDISRIFESVRLLCDAEAVKKKTRLSFNAASITWSVNPGLLEQAVLNLVQNAIRYSPEGATIAVEAARAGDCLHITVADDGPGIPEKHREAIFERFYRIDRGRSREQGGTGLGLSIVKHIALAHEGKVELVSREGEGSVFTISIP